MTVDNKERIPSLFVGIDQSYSGFGIVILDDYGELLRTELWSFPPMKSDGERLYKIYLQFSDWIFDLCHGYGKFVDFWSIDQENIHFAMEGYSYGSILNREKMGELGGIIKMALDIAERPIKIVPPSELKKSMTGNGNASKEDMVNAVQFFEPSITNHNLADAYSLAYMLYSSS